MSSKRNKNHSQHALVLTGGGARAAYQVGVLSAIAKFVPRNHPSPFPILCGTSAGAINSTALACYTSCFQLGVKKLEWVWKNFNISQVYHCDPTRVYGHIAYGMLASFQADYANKSSHSLLNNAPLRHLLNRLIDFRRIDRNILQGTLSALSVTASSYSNGDSISFYQGKDNIQPWSRVKRKGEKSQLNTEHLMASAAIPMVFPSVKIKNQYFGDGSVHQLSPLSPAIHLGAKRLFIIGVEQPKELIHPNENNPHPPTGATVAGHLLDSIFSDTMSSDLERMSRINATLQLIPQEVRAKNEGLQHIDSFVVNPSHNFNAIASDYYQDLPLSIRLLLRSSGIKSESDSSIMSYLLFDKNFCSELIKLGFEDAMQKESSIRAFLDL
ncbi:patatin-like phospholipase family protein [Colwellia sp. D2M02]|uniref:Patatin-like phospholipase family protein n=1 Tax=Colwellia asteriadis TaxID=517723 RepID=A0ABN1L699_9GAMM|nr:patatin-like phospholipase family protein [Colwellia sp. D2M02]MBU2893935.1 patatin-like phospholipase family protein [Colwellia sp. D2M02]